MKDRIAELLVPFTSDFGQKLHHVLSVTLYESRNQLIVQLVEKLSVAGKPSTIEQRNGELDVLGVQTRTLAHWARRRTHTKPKIPQLLIEFTDAILHFRIGLLRLGEEQQVDIGVRQQELATVAAESEQCQPGGFVQVRGNELLPQALDDGIDQRATPGRGSFAVPGCFKGLANGRGFSAMKFDQIE